MADSTSIQHELQEKLRRCRGKQGLQFSSAGRLSPGVKGTALPCHALNPHLDNNTDRAYSPDLWSDRLCRDLI